MLACERILYPTDLSPEGDEALRYAIALARANNAALFVLTWTEDLAPAKSLPRLELNESLKGVFERKLASHLPYGDLKELDWHFVLAEGASPAAAISREASERKVDLIIMRSRRRPRAAALLGSTAERVARTAPCPVLIIHRQEREWVGASMGEIDLRRILIGHDFSEYGELALDYGLALAQEYQAELHLLHVLSPPAEESPEISWSPAAAEGAYHQAARRLQKCIPKEAHLWCAVKTGVRWGKPHRELLAYADENEIDLISVGAHGGGRGLSTLFGSTADRVLRHAPCPVLVARPLSRRTSDPQAEHRGTGSQPAVHQVNESPGLKNPKRY